MCYFSAKTLNYVDICGKRLYSLFKIGKNRDLTKRVNVIFYLIVGGMAAFL